MTCDKDSIVEYLYDEVSAAERRQIDRHLASCPDCRDEVEALRQTRTTLAAWNPPETDLGFEVVRRPTVVSARARTFRLSPRWGLAAAAVLVLAAAAAIANVQIEAGTGGVVIRTGWKQAPAAPREARLSVQPAPVSVEDLAALSQRLQAIETALQTPRPAVTPVSAAAGAAQVPTAEVLRQVRQLIADSEKRQQGQLALLIGQVHRDVEAARRVDLARLQQVLAQIQGVTDAQLVRQSRLEDQILRIGHQQR